ncbi:MAG: LysM peptidoglycan-binding domain-containing protein [Actinomycetota bacterium]|nr:LysM peptidoglycan-binding domain-containing protein [Actinomycetota bacterium]
MISQRSTSARALVIISTTVAAFVLLLATAVHAMTGGDPLATVDYRVHAGDTLWSIAVDTIAPGEDVRGMISTIQDLNDLPTSAILVGEVLQIPSHDEA